MIGSGVADGCVVGLGVGPVKAGRGGLVIVPAAHGRALRTAAQLHHEASRRRAWEGPVGSGGDRWRGASCSPLRRFPAQAVALELDPVGGVEHAVEDRVAEGRVSDDVVP